MGNTFLWTVIITFITWRPTATVHPVREVTLNTRRFIYLRHQPIRTLEVSGCATLAVPILDTAVGVLPPPSPLLRTVQVVSTVNRRGRVFTVFITLVTDRPLTTHGVLREVTAVIPWVKHCGLGIVIWLGTESVLWRGFFAEAMPECATVELIWKPAGTKILALDMLIIRCAVWWGGGCCLTFFIAFITDRPPTTLGLLRKVAAHV